jgi:hypothetical protein
MNTKTAVITTGIITAVFVLYTNGRCLTKNIITA